MAKPIKETPVLRGDDARRFLDKFDDLKKQQEPIDPDIAKLVSDNFWDLLD